jgi:dihydrofolate reductase
MIAAIFAVDSQGGLGKNGTLPWPKDREDLTWFKENTTGHIVIMGRNTWEDPMMPKPLPNRVNCVVTSSDNLHMADKTNAIIKGHKLEDALADLEENFELRTIWIIGGAQLLKSTHHLIDQVYLTRFDDSYDCDVKLDIDEYLNNFELTSEVPGEGKRFQIYHAKLS